MSFLDDILDVGSSVWNMVTGPSTGGAIARAAALGYMLNEVTASINKDNQKPAAADSNKPDPGVREQVDPNTDHAIPVVYGTAFLGGIVTDAVLTNSNQTMWYCITICEKTGPHLSGSPSTISIDKVYWDQNVVNFKSDGVTVASFSNEEGTVTSDNPADLIKFYFFSGGSTSPIPVLGYSQPSAAAYSLFPNWTANHTMNDLVFVLIRVDYNKQKGITGLGNIEFKVRNSLTDPGDVLNDYMTNTRYGAGIPAEEINA